MKEIRTALEAYNTITAYRSAQKRLSDDAFVKFCNGNPQLMKFMEEIWKLQEEDQHATDG